MKKTSTILADGRELIYFDEDPTSDRSDEDVRDTRDLPHRAGGSELRYDALLDEWVAVAAHRQTRTFLPPSDQCPLCPSRPGRASEIPASAYEVVVFENRFPSFASDAPAVERDPHAPELFGRRPGVGRCEVVCFTSDHSTSFSALSPRRARLVVDVWADRTAALSDVPGVEQVFCFENRGEEIGVTLHHPHGQIYAYPFLPPRTKKMLAAARRHAARTGGRSLYQDVLTAERAAGTRVVAANPHWTAFVPAAARWPYEVHIAPHRRAADLPMLTSVERDAFAPLYLEVLGRFDALFDGAPAPVVSAWHQAPVRDGRELGYLHLQLFTIRRAPGKLKYLAGSESAMGVFISDVTPEQAADQLRAAS
jgi:UDPglucose--hexose-1-phosphate uridylyltransferase